MSNNLCGSMQSIGTLVGEMNVPILAAILAKGSVTPEFLDRTYWERGVYISGSPISTFDSLFETVGFLNDGKISYVCVHISVDDPNKKFISGYYFAYGKKSINNTAVYLVDPINSEYWTINYSDGVYEAIQNDSFIKRESHTVSTFAELDEIITQDTLTKCVYVFTFPEGSEIFNKTNSSNFIAFGNRYIDINSGKTWRYAGNGEFYFSELYARVGSITVINDTGHLNVLFDDDIHLINAEIGSAKGIASGHYSGVRYADRDGKGGYVLTNTKTGDVYSYDRDNETFDKLSITVDDFLSVESENLVKNKVIAKALQNTITVKDMTTVVNHEFLDKAYNQGYGLVHFDVSDSSGFLPFGRYLALRYRNPSDSYGYLVINIDTGTLYQHSLGSKYCKLIFDPAAINGVINAGTFLYADDLINYGFETGKRYLCIFMANLSELIGSSGLFICSCYDDKLYYFGGYTYCSGTINLTTGKVEDTKMMLTKDSVLDNVILADRVTGKNYSLYVADGKLTLEESEV